ncbi:TraB family protein [Candidatus Woesearchaeota archaeon]|nr:TraB family protein [Candidatus Woesearchaeota archaeon]
MQLFENLILIGTSHIAKQSVIEVEEIIQKERPDVVALELDRSRFFALVNKIHGRLSIKDIKLIGFKGFVFAKFGEFIERKLGGKVGVNPGEELLKAAEVASKHGCKIALIDQKIEITLKNFSNEITWKEKFRFVLDVVKGFFSKKHRIKIDLRKVPEKELINTILKQVKERYPNFYRVLVEDRNKYMAKKLFKLMRNYNKIVAVVGAGHEEEIIEDIKLLRRSN